MTLVELMVVVTIIGLTVVAFAPSFGRTLADRRCATATMELVRMGRRARSDAIGLQRAMLVHIDYGRPPTQTAMLRVLRGNVARCDAEDWAARQNECRADRAHETSASACTETVDFSNTHWLKEPFSMIVAMWPANETQVSRTPETLIRNVARGGGGSMAICYEPSGIIRWTTERPARGDTMRFSTLNTNEAAGGGLMFAVGIWHRRDDEPSNTPRLLLYPLAGAPRRLR